MSADAAAEPGLLPLFAEQIEPSDAQTTTLNSEVSPGDGAGGGPAGGAAALAFIIAEIARINGRATAREGGLPRGAECLDAAGLIDAAAIAEGDPVTLDLIRSGKTLGCFEIAAAPSPVRGAVRGADGICTPSSLYRSAWLKAHFPVEFLTGVLECDPDGGSRHRLIAEATRMRIPLLPLDINESGATYAVERIAKEVKGIRLALTEAVGMSADAIARILQARPFASITDVRERADLGPELMLNLARAGAFDSLVDDGPPTILPSADASSRWRGEIIAFVRQLVARPRKVSAKAAAIQDCLLGADDLGEAALRDPSLPTGKGIAEPAVVGAGDHSAHSDDGAGIGPDDGSGDSFDAEVAGQSVAGEHVLDDSASGSSRLTAVDGGANGVPADELDPVARFRSLLDELGATSADRALWSRPGTAVLVAGAGGSPVEASLVDQLDEVVEVWSLDDGTEAVDVVCVSERGGDPDGPMLGSRPLLVRGRTQVTDEGTAYVEAEEIVDLEQLWSEWQDAHVA